MSEKYFSFQFLYFIEGRKRKECLKLKRPVINNNKMKAKYTTLSEEFRGNTNNRQWPNEKRQKDKQRSTNHYTEN
jgi:hypothetical protein